MHFPTDSAARKLLPVATGVVDYFPDALVALSDLSRKGNDKHNPGEPLHWARGKGGNNADELMRHFIDRGAVDPDDGVRHSAKVAWRALAILQLEIEAARAMPVAKAPPPSNPISCRFDLDPDTVALGSCGVCGAIWGAGAPRPIKCYLRNVKGDEPSHQYAVSASYRSDCIIHNLATMLSNG